MTLIVSLRTPDGIVIAGDSLATMMANAEVGADLNVICPQCNHQHISQQVIGLPPMPATTLSYAQKIFPFLDDYAIGTFGVGILAGKTINFAIRELEKEIKGKPITQKPSNVTEAAKRAGEYVHSLLKEQFKLEKQDLDKFPADQFPLGLHVVGYDKTDAKTITVTIGKTVQYMENKGAGIAASGETLVLQTLGSIYTQNQLMKPVYELFSLQDAIEYAEFAISTTASFQHFSRSMATVGGDVDIALVTPFEHFKWIKQKSLQSRLIGGSK